jgi:hypothetical protein
MGWGNPILLLLGALALRLVSAGVEDLRTREIANWKNAAIALLAPLWWWANGLALWPDLALQIGLALVVFGLFCIAFARGWMGGGDVKMIGALALWCIDTGAADRHVVGRRPADDRVDDRPETAEIRRSNRDSVRRGDRHRGVFRAPPTDP